MATTTDGTWQLADGPEQRRERDRRLRETFHSIVVHGNFEFVAQSGAKPLLRLDAGHSLFKPSSNAWGCREKSTASGERALDMFPQVVEPRATSELDCGSANGSVDHRQNNDILVTEPLWYFCAEADMTLAAEVLAFDAEDTRQADMPPADSPSLRVYRSDGSHAQVASPHVSFPGSEEADRRRTDEAAVSTSCPDATDHEDALASDASQGRAKEFRVDAGGTGRTGKPVLAGRIDDDRWGPLFPIDDAYRRLRDQILPLTHDKPAALAWVGAQALEDGASLLTALATALAERGTDNQVLLVDADFQMFALSRRFRRPGSLGLGDVISGKKPWPQAVLSTALAQIDVLPCGSLCDHQMATLTAGYWQRLLAEWKQHYRYIVVDAGTPDQPSLAAMLQAVDSTYVVVEYDRTSRAGVAEAVDQLRRWGVANLATVMVGVPVTEYAA